MGAGFCFNRSIPGTVRGLMAGTVTGRSGRGWGVNTPMGRSANGGIVDIVEREGRGASQHRRANNVERSKGVPEGGETPSQRRRAVE